MTSYRTMCRTHKCRGRRDAQERLTRSRRTVRRLPDSLPRRTARHGACNVFRYPKRLQPGKRRAGLARWQSDGVVASLECSGKSRCNTGYRPCCARVYTPEAERQKAALLLQACPPSPRGGFRRPSNITRDYAPWSVGTSPQTTRAAPPAHGALRRIISVMCKWPRSAKDAL
jgi:hypothetical protein